MSSLGFAIIFYVCGAGDPDCRQVGVRASRFMDLRQCQATVPDALRQARRHRGEGTTIVAACRDLDEVCAPTLTTAQPFGAIRLKAPLLHLATAAAPRAPIDGALAILCAKPPQADCGT